MSVADYLENLFGLKGQVAVVIGGAGELGASLGSGLVRAGAHVVVADLNEEHCLQRVEEHQAIGGQASHAAVNITDRASIEALAAKALEVSGRIDMLVNCAGINAGNPFLEVDPDLWDKIMAVNLKGMFEACQVFIPRMIEAGGGSILNIGSVTSQLPLSRVYAYGASKAAVVNLTKNIAQEFAAQNVRANAICPGFFPAEQNRKLLDEERVANIMRGTPMNRYGEPGELIGAALLLLSKNAGSYMTGAAVNVDGGFTCSWF